MFKIFISGGVAVSGISVTDERQKGTTTTTKKWEIESKKNRKVNATVDASERVLFFVFCFFFLQKEKENCYAVNVTVDFRNRIFFGW